MKFGFFQRKNVIALANGRPVEPVGSIQPHIQFLRVTLQFVTSKAVDLKTVGVIKAFLP
jgi:hypothetical protein